MSVTISWSDALTGQLCGLYDNNVRNDFCAVQEAFETTCPADVPKNFAHSASLDPTAMERAGLRVEKEEGVACPPWWLPLFMGDPDPVHSGSRVAHGDVDDGIPHRALTSHHSAEQPTPVDSLSHAPNMKRSNGTTPTPSPKDCAALDDKKTCRKKDRKKAIRA